MIENIDFKKIAGFILVAGAGFGTFLGVRKLVKNGQQNSESKHAGEQNHPATYATLLKQAFENDSWLGAGTDEEAVYRVLQSIPSNKVWRGVQSSYKTMFGNSLNDELRDELTSSELNKAFEIIRNYQ